MSTTYINLSEISEMQKNIMRFVDWWVHEKKIPIPRAEIIKEMEANGVKMPTTRLAIYVLLKKGYLREAVTISNKTTYVQLRSI